MSKGKNKGASKSDAPESESAAPSFVLVTNKRGGTIYVGSSKFKPGESVHDAAVFAAFPEPVQDALADMVSEGWLAFKPHDVPDAPAPVVVELPKLPESAAPPAVVFPTPEAVAASTSPAELDGWFNTPGLPADLSELILARHSALSPA